MITNIFFIYWLVVFVSLFTMFLLLIINLLTFPRLRKPTNTSTSILPYISILVPARNEAHCIEACVRSLLAQTYPQLEILVLNDNSTDNTAAIVQSIIDEPPATKTGRLRLLEGQPLPVGWVGKNFACQQLAQQAQGDYLLFTDADTVHELPMAASVIACMQHFDVKLLTAQPEFVLGSFGECLIIPLLNFTIMTLLPIALVRLRPEASLATGNGQLLCFHRTAYEAIGGHASVKEKILEDVLLARAVKAAGYRMIFVDALELLRCRMYTSFTEVWQGFSKNLFAFYNYSLLFALLALLLNLALFVTPPLLALIALLFHLSFALFTAGLVAYTLAVCMRIILTLRFTRAKQSHVSLLLLCFLHPLSILLECLILLNSMRLRYRNKGVEWKDRYYHL